MSELCACDRFLEWLSTEVDGGDATAWSGHLGQCESCREQWLAHQLLRASFATSPAPRLSPWFDTGLRARLAEADRRRPLAGWRLAALAGYAVAAGGGFSWLLVCFPPISLASLTSPWTAALALAAAPLTLWMAAGVAKRLPARRGLALGGRKG